MSIARRWRTPLFALLFSLAFLACAPPRAAAQNTGTTVVPAPPFIITNDVGMHYGKQNDKDPETAHDRWAGQDLKWDRDKKTWVDIKTGQALGFDGQLASDGTVIPAPPFINTPGVGMHEARQHRPTDNSGTGNPETAYDDATGQLLRWDREKQSWFETKWDSNTRTRIETGQPLGFNGVVVNAPAPPAAVPASETGATGPCPAAEDCVVLKQIYDEADALALKAAQTLVQATADRENDLAQAAQLDKSASHRGDPDVSKAEHQQAQGLRDKLPNAQANYDAAAKACITAWENYQNCLKGLLKDCPPKKPAQASNETGTTNTTTGSTASTTPAAASQTPSNASLAGDLCERAKALRDIAAKDRQMADAAQDPRTKDPLLSDAKMMDGMAKEREDLAHHYDPNACPEHAQAIPGGGGPSQNGAGSQSTGGTSTTPAWGPWIIIFPGMPLWNTEERRWYGQNSDGTPREEKSQAGADTWIMIFPGLPLWNVDEQRWYGYNSDYSPRKDEQPEEGPTNTSSISSATPAPAGGTPGGPAFQCTANAPIFNAGMVDIPLTCNGTPPPNSSIGLRSNVPFNGADLQYSFGSTPPITISETPTNNDHRARFNLPNDLGKLSSDFKMDFKFKPNLEMTRNFTPYGHINLDLFDSPGTSITPRDFTAPITNNQIGPFTSAAPFANEWGGTIGGPIRRDLTFGFGDFTSRFGWGLDRTAALCTDTTTTTFLPRNDFGLTVTPPDWFTPPPCTLNDNRGSLTLGGSNDFGFGGLRGWSAFNTPGGANIGGGWGQTPQTSFSGGFFNPSPSPFGFIRPQAFFDDNGPQSRFGIFDPWNRMPSFCDYDFPDKLRSMPQIAQALAEEARSRRPRESRASSEPGGAHLELVSLRRGSPVSDSPSRPARPAKPAAPAPAPDDPLSAPTFTYAIVANGKSQGQAFELQVADTTGKVKTVAMRDGTIIEAIKPGVTQPLEASAGDAVVKGPLNGFCLEFHKPPPAPGTLYRIADQATQQKYASLRYLDMAAARMSEKNEFHPDSNPEDYKNSIFQYAVWSELEGWGQEEFTQHFVERVKENVQAKNVQWTKEMENQLLAAAPGRWRDISEMRNQAQALEKASEERRSARRSRRQQQ